MCSLNNKQIDVVSQYADHAGPVRPGQQSRRPDATEAGRHDGPQQESYTGQSTDSQLVLPLIISNIPFNMTQHILLELRMSGRIASS